MKNYTNSAIKVGSAVAANICFFALAAPAHAITVIYTFSQSSADPAPGTFTSPGIFRACRSIGGGANECGNGTISGSFAYNTVTNAYTNLNVSYTFELYVGAGGVDGIIPSTGPSSTLSFFDSNDNPDSAVGTLWPLSINGINLGPIKANEIRFCSNFNPGTNGCSANALSSSLTADGSSNVWLNGVEVPSPISFLGVLPLAGVFRLRKRALKRYGSLNV